jgi:hypothetical protein
MQNKIDAKHPILLVVLALLLMSFTGLNTTHFYGNTPVDLKGKDPLKKSTEVSSSRALWKQYTYSNYQCLNDSTLPFEAFQQGLKGFYNLKEEGELTNDSILTIIDFTQHSSHQRMYLINVSTFRVIDKTLCAHGKNTGGAFAKNFSNRSGSLQSSLGFYITAETYSGKFDYALRLDGVEFSNSLARPRGIVMHGASYATPQFLKRNNNVLGRSFGCPALPENVAKKYIDQIKEGSCLFIYGNSATYERRAELIHDNSHLEDFDLF